VLTPDNILTGTMFLGLFAMVLFFIKNDEMPILFVLFFYTSGIQRYNLVKAGASRWVVVAYSKNIFNLNDELGLQALNYFFLGTLVITLSYALFAFYRKPPSVFYDDKITLLYFLKQNQVLIITGFVLIASVSFYAKRAFIASFLETGGGLALGGSYYQMIGFGLGGVIPLMYLIFRSFEFKTQFIPKLAIGAIMAFAASLTYSSSGRFQFISWAITIGIILVGDSNPFYKLRIYLLGGFAVSLAFGLAGVSRRVDTAKMGNFEKLSAAWQRNKSTEDATMLDGFMMVLQVYPQHLDYHYGTEHLEILYRPIPRSIWPDKPLGGYANKLGLNENMAGGSVGISQSLYGTFYGEGGVAGIVILSIVYAFLINRIMKNSLNFNSDTRHMIKGATIASIIPLLRGGDLPGIYAFIGMSFWPIMFFVSRYKAFSKTIMFQRRSFLANKKAEEIKEQEVYV